MGHFNLHVDGAVAARRLRAGGFAVAASLLLLATLLVAPAEADDIECGDVITEDTTLTHDVGPCGDADGPAGLIVRGDDITLDLDGHRVFSTEEANGPLEQVGIRIGRSTGVTVQNGTVEGFDAGVEIMMGGGNTVQGITAQNNVNDMEEPFIFVSGDAPADQPAVQSGEATVGEYNANMLCFYGDGITATASDNNVIRDNRVLDNGPYGGITMVADSDNNEIANNHVAGNNLPNETQSSPDPDQVGDSALCGATLPGAPGMQRGRGMQNIGIRMEGPGANHNVVDENFVDDNGLAGITVHSYLCQPREGSPFPPQPDNSENVISNNTVRNTGMSTDHGYADGIASQAQGPTGSTTCTSPDTTIVNNNTSNNKRHGLALHETAADNLVEGNVANNNGGYGIFVAENLEYNDFIGPLNNELNNNRAHNNGMEDGFDGNPDCETNEWSANRFKTVNQDCVTDGNGTGWTGGGPGDSGNAPGNNR